MFNSDAPRITVGNRRIGQKLGGQVVLECIVSAEPSANFTWTRPNAAADQALALLEPDQAAELQYVGGSPTMTAADGVEQLIVVAATSEKFIIEEYEENDGKLMRLNVKGLESNDYGDYRCVAINALGRDERTVTVYGQSVEKIGSTVPTRHGYNALQDKPQALFDGVCMGDHCRSVGEGPGASLREISPGPRHKGPLRSAG